MKKWAVLDPYIVNPSTASIERLQSRHKDIQFDTFAVANEQWPQNPAHYAGYISLGSRAHITEPVPWMKKLATLLDQQLNQNKPVLGICFTHQLMVDYWGGQVAYAYPDQRSLKGVRTLQLRGEVPPFKEHMQLAYTHQQRVVSISQNLENLGGSLFDYEVLRHRELPYLSFQAHPEASTEFCHSEVELTDVELIRIAQAHGDAVIDHFIRA